VQPLVLEGELALMNEQAHIHFAARHASSMVSNGITTCTVSGW
jgi:hypothetical protein